MFSNVLTNEFVCVNDSTALISNWKKKKIDKQFFGFYFWRGILNISFLNTSPHIWQINDVIASRITKTAAQCAGYDCGRIVVTHDEDI